MTLPIFARRFALLILLFATTACVGHRHSVGLGATGTQSVQARQWYVLFGLFEANEVDAQRMADGLTSYEIVTEYSLLDILLQPLLLPLTVTTRTVTVRT
ncbi:MAG: hypothetical protein AB8H80_03895 [Planctomycetota bacterium]